MRNLSLILIFLPILLLSQPSGYNSGSASVNLIMPLSIEYGPGDLDFGEIITTGVDSREEIEPRAGKQFIIRGDANRFVSIVFNDVILDNFRWASITNGESSTLTFKPNIELNNGNRLKSGDNLILRQNGLAGKLDIHVGGYIDIKADQPIGDYQGKLVISISY